MPNQPIEPAGAGATEGGTDPARRRRVADAIARWTADLVDLTARNSLLYYRDLVRGTVDLSGRERDAEPLLAGDGVRLSAIFAASPPGDLAVRARAIRAKAREAQEERGIDVLFLAWGMATWDEPEAARALPLQAPVVLVPVALRPAPGAPGADHVLRVTGDARVNPTLLRRLALDHGVRIDVEEADRRLRAAATFRELGIAFEVLRTACRGVPGFAVAPRLVLSTFSYARLPMVRDLEAAQDALAAHDVVAAVVGDPAARATLRARARAVEPPVDLPDRTPPDEEFLVLDADAAQTHTINRVRAGQDLIVQGPPGTGKSQTIANLVATLAAEGRTVLFVAEKRAAIEAVVGRLRDRGLGDLVLDLHEGGPRREEVADALWRAAEPPPDPADDDGHVPADPALLVAAREELNARTLAQHASRVPWGVTVFEARMRRAALPAGAATDLRLGDDALDDLDADTVRRAREELARWFAIGGPLLSRGAHGWAGARILDEHDVTRGRDAAETALAALRTLLRHVDRLGTETALPPPATVAGAEAQADLAARAAALAEVFDPGVYEEDLDGLISALAPRRGLRRLVGGGGATGAREARQTAEGVLLPDHRAMSPEDLHTRLGEARALAGDWRRMSTAFATPRPSGAADDVRAAAAALRAALGGLADLLPGAGLEERDLRELDAMLAEMRADTATLRTVREVRAAERWLEEHHLGDLLGEVRDRALDRETGLGRLEWVWLSGILERLALEDPHVGVVAGPDALVQRFQEADRRHMAEGPARVRAAHAGHMRAVLDAHPDEALLVQRQARLATRSRRHLSVRELVEQAPHAVRALRPCWAMSPLTVSQALPPWPGLFDVVVFDEASQITPAEAMPAILRGARVVVVGDRNQLPPTTFFAAAVGEGEVDGLAADEGTEGYESILDALTGLVPERLLTWHYRSRDERLIAFSNREIYEGALTTFPGVGRADAVRHELVAPGPAERRGGDDSSEAEVRRVCELVRAHARVRPGESLAVIAMGARHADRVDDAVRALAADDDAVGELLAEDRPEPFFVKNLERVQGDERDAVILTIGYGRDARTGRLSYRFGPLLQEGGDRRLNVAVTRARRRLTVVSSFAHEEMDPERCGAPGLALLRAYLAYAAAGGEGEMPAPDIARAHAPLARHLEEALTRAGVPVIRDLGASGHRIDLALAHPEDPTRQVLAVECDGPAYHLSPIARERDRLRQEQLEARGWHFHRVWSSEWAADPRGVVDRVLLAWNRAVESHDRAEAESLR